MMDAFAQCSQYPDTVYVQMDTAAAVMVGVIFMIAVCAITVMFYNTVVRRTWTS